MSLSTAAFDAMPPALRHRTIAWQYRLSEGELRRLGEFVPRDRTAIDVGAW